MAQQQTSNFFTFFRLCGHLKHLKRTGWVNNNVKNPETISGHMYRMAMMAFLFGKDSKTPVSQERCIKMALVHDLAESIVGDLTPSCGVSKEEKHKREKEAMDSITGLLPKEVAEEILQLWKEYEDHVSPEAIAVHDLDKFDMIFQAYEYETEQHGSGELQQFFDSTKGIFQTSEVKHWVEALEEERQQTSVTSTLSKN